MGIVVFDSFGQIVVIGITVVGGGTIIPIQDCWYKGDMPNPKPTYVGVREWENGGTLSGIFRGPLFS